MTNAIEEKTSSTSTLYRLMTAVDFDRSYLEPYPVKDTDIAELDMAGLISHIVTNIMNLRRVYDPFISPDIPDTEDIFDPNILDEGEYDVFCALFDVTNVTELTLHDIGLKCPKDKQVAKIIFYKPSAISQLERRRLLKGLKEDSAFREKVLNDTAERYVLQGYCYFVPERLDPELAAKVSGAGRDVLRRVQFDLVPAIHLNVPAATNHLTNLASISPTDAEWMYKKHIAAIKAITSAGFVSRAEYISKNLSKQIDKLNVLLDGIRHKVSPEIEALLSIFDNVYKPTDMEERS